MDQGRENNVKAEGGEYGDSIGDHYHHCDYVVAKRTVEEAQMIEIKDNYITEGYSLEDLICAERENARLNCQIEQLYRSLGSSGLEDKVRLIFGWNKEESSK